MARDSRDLAACEKELRAKAEDLIGQFWRRFAPFYLLPVMTQRSQETHDAYWAQGRAELDVVNQLRRLAKLAPITAEDNYEVTWTRNSRHLIVPSHAIDFAITLDADGPTGPMKPVIQWDDLPRYRAMGEMAERMGLKWGGDKDGGHVELIDVPIVRGIAA